MLDWKKMTLKINSWVKDNAVFIQCDVISFIPFLDVLKNKNSNE